MVDFLFLDKPLVEEGSWEAVVKDEAAPAVLDGALALYAACEWTADVLHRATQGLADDMGRKLNKVQVPVRVAVTGRRVGPPLFQSLEALGREAVLERLRGARQRLEAATG
jgi:glutamyl-tRNA synthetase